MNAQNLLTIAIEAVAIIGFGGIILHALYTAFIKPILDLRKPYNPEEWTEQQIEWSKQVVEAHKASLELPAVPVKKVEKAEKAVELKTQRKSKKNKEVSADKPVENVKRSRKKKAA